MEPERITGIRDGDVKEQLHLRKGRTMGTASKDEAGDRNYAWEARRHCMRSVEKTHSLEMAKQTVGTSIRPRKMAAWALWRSRPPPKQKKSLQAAFRIGAIDVRELTTL
jgi:hypothetical protein